MPAASRTCGESPLSPSFITFAPDRTARRDLSPVCMAAALHFDLSVHNFGIQEHMGHAPETEAVFPHAYSFADGYMHAGEKPGLGVEIDEPLAAKYPYQKAYLPINRKLDGSLHSW